MCADRTVCVCVFVLAEYKVRLCKRNRGCIQLFFNASCCGENKCECNLSPPPVTASMDNSCHSHCSTSQTGIVYVCAVWMYPPCIQCIYVLTVLWACRSISFSHSSRWVPSVCLQSLPMNVCVCVECVFEHIQYVDRCCGCVHSWMCNVSVFGWLIMLSRSVRETNVLLSVNFSAWIQLSAWHHLLHHALSDNSLNHLHKSNRRRMFLHKH